MYAWPWSLAYAIALFAPALLLLARVFDRRRPLHLPTAGVCAALLLLATGLLASALASPYRGSAVLWCAPLLAGIAIFFVAFDWLQGNAGGTSEPARAAAIARLLTGAGWFFVVVAVVSLGLWLRDLPAHLSENLLAARNPFPLGHSNYTAGLALLMLPCFLALAVRGAGVRRAGWAFAVLLALALLLTSGSRGGFLGLAALALLHVRALAARLRVKLWMVILGAAIALAAFLYWNPRTRAGFGGALSASDVQRAAMLHAAARMGLDRPLLGWGPGTTPLAYPRYRASLEGGTENVLQLHSTPAQLWAELGAVNLLAVLALGVLAWRAARRSALAATVFWALGGYAVFCFTDWQLDVPVFVAALAVAGAMLAAAAPPDASDAEKTYSLFRLGRRSVAMRLHEDEAGIRRIVGVITLLSLAVIAGAGRPDPTPELNTRALALATDPARTDEAIALLRRSLALNYHQEIAHFNLGWLLVVREPAAAEKHFLAAAQLVPDKGGAYFGLGLARLNQRRNDDAARAFALECLNDPAFLVSPWWRAAGIKETRSSALVRLTQQQSLVAAALPEKSALHAEAVYVRELTLWLATGAAVADPNTPARTAYFATKPLPPPFENAPPRQYRRERTGYPVLMRNLDLPVPTDLFDVQDNALATGEFSFLFPAKGWLASPVLPALLLESESRPK